MTTALDIKNPRHIRWIALGLFALAIITRIPFQSQYLYHWDSVNMAFGILDYDVQAGAPQFPGYIVYIVIAQIVNAVFNDPQRTMLFISVVSSGLAAAAIFYLGKDMFNPVTGIIASLFLISSPLFWFYGEIALPHALDLFAIDHGVRGPLWPAAIVPVLMAVFALAWLRLSRRLAEEDELFMIELLRFSLDAEVAPNPNGRQSA